MLCLGQKICCHKAWICCLISKNKDFTRSCDRINTYKSINCLLCKSYIDISRSYNLIDLRNRFCSICKRCNCLCSSNFINFICTGLFCRNQCCRSYFSVFSRRCYHDDLIYTCNLRRHDIHKYGRWISCLSSRHINTDSLECCHLLSKNCSVRFAVKPAVLHLFLVIVSDIHKCFSDNGDQFIIYLFICFCDFFFRYKEMLCVQSDSVKFLCIIKYSFVSFFFHRIQYFLNTCLEFSIVIRASL